MYGESNIPQEPLEIGANIDVRVEIRNGTVYVAEHIQVNTGNGALFVIMQGREPVRCFGRSLSQRYRVDIRIDIVGFTLLCALNDRFPELLAS